jgi:hypothetical protein
MELVAFLDFPALSGRFSRACGLRREAFSLSMIFTDSRYPLFGIMLQTAG